MVTKMADRPQLDAPFCLNIVVSATGHRGDFESTYNSDPATTLNELGIIDSTQMAVHRAQIQSLLYQQGYLIKQQEIKGYSNDSFEMTSC